jgi:hypothetical protein
VRRKFTDLGTEFDLHGLETPVRQVLPEASRFEQRFRKERRRRKPDPVALERFNDELDAFGGRPMAEDRAAMARECTTERAPGCRPDNANFGKPHRQRHKAFLTTQGQGKAQHEVRVLAIHLAAISKCKLRTSHGRACTYPALIWPVGDIDYPVCTARGLS